MDTTSNFLSVMSFLMLCSIKVSSLSPLNITNDQLALLAFKSHITDPRNILAKNWASTTSVCSWIGVTCSSHHHRVTALNISNMRLVGTLSPYLGNLSFLISLDASFNYFHGNIPMEFAHFHRLKFMDLSFNNHNGEVPSWLGSLTELQFLHLQNNSFTGQLPTALSNVSKLVSLNLHYNLLEGRIPEAIGNLKNLKVLSLRQNQLSSSIPLAIYNISSIQIVDFSYNNLIGNLPANMCSTFKELEQFYVSFNQLYGQIPSKLNICLKLQTLGLSWNNFVGFFPKEIGNLSMINLALGGNHFTGAVPDVFGNFHMLEGLGLEANNFTGPLPETIFNISTLKILSLSANYFTGNLPSRLGLQLQNIEILYLGGNLLSGSILDHISNATKLSELVLFQNFFTGSIPTSIGNLEQLDKLVLGENQFTSDQELSFLSSLTNCRHLRELDIGINPLFGELPAAIGNLSFSLEKFYALCTGIKGEIPEGIGNLSSLTVLSLTDNGLSGGIPSTIKGLKNLQGLFLTNNSISGSIPDEICDLVNLAQLNLSNNLLHGQVPGCLGSMNMMRYLYLDSNRLNSSLPSTFWSLKDLVGLDLSSNFLIGTLPPEIGSFRALILLNLSMNQFSGTIPTTIGGIRSLISLSVTHNEFQGPIPESIGNMLSLKLLDLSYNNLSGVIPKSLEALSDLQDFNVSFNRLTGEIPNGGPFVNFTKQSFMSNEVLCGAPQLQVPPCLPTVHKKTKKGVTLALWLSLGIALPMIAMIITFVLVRRQKNTKIPADIHSSLDRLVERISYYELQKATIGFDQRNLLGIGSFGSVYKGMLSDGKFVAIKVFNLQLESASNSFDRECKMLCNLRHRNLTKVISSCSNLDFKALILEYLPNGSLDKWLYSHNHFLSVLQRLDIMIDVASALEYLHNGYSAPVVHCDFKPSNVLLDENMVAHVTDFGISKLLGEGQSIAQTNTLATIGYIAPEYGLDGLVSTMSDVYSFGIMMMETFTRMRPSDEKFVGDQTLRSWVSESLPYGTFQIIDPNLLRPIEEKLNASLDCLSSVMELALRCSAEAPEDRICIEDVVSLLKKIKVQYLA